MGTPSTHVFAAISGAPGAGARPGFSPEVAVCFAVTDEQQHRLLSPFAYPTYRGS